MGNEGAIAEVQGRLATAAELARKWGAARAGRGAPEGPLTAELLIALDEIWFRDDRPGAIARAERALGATPLESIPAVQRPYILLAEVFARAGDLARSRRVLAQMSAALPPEAANLPDNDPRSVQGLIALAEHRPAEAAPLLIAAGARSECDICSLPDLGRAYDALGQADSALAVYQRYVSSASPRKFFVDPLFLAGTLKRLGELYEARGDTARAVSAYARVTALWKNADPELQPRVAEVERHLAALTRGEGLNAPARTAH